MQLTILCKILPLSPYIQSRVQTIASTTCGLSELRYWSKTRLPTLNADSDTTVDIGMLKISRAIIASSENRIALTFQKFKISKSIVSWSFGSSKYICNWVFLVNWLSDVSLSNDSHSYKYLLIKNNVNIMQIIHIYII